jgi:ABC-type multidrug transport system fused ATPase/permease subunit
MGDQVEGKWVVPNPQIPRTFGMMNLVFGILLLLMGAGYLGMYLVMPVWQQKVAAQMKEQQENLKKGRANKLAELKAKEAAAKAKEAAAKTKEETEKAKEETTAAVEERETFENNPDVDLSGMTDMMGWNIMADRRVAVYYFSEVIGGIVLNVAMIISGIGLMGLTEWGRKLGITVAWLKILRWIAMTIVIMVVIVPITTEKMDKMMQSVQAQVNAKSGGRPAPVPMVGFGQMMAVMSAVAVVFSGLVASIYPILSLWFLTRPPTRVACLKGSKPTPLEPRSEVGDPL